MCEEARPAITSFDVVKHIRVMRLQWLASLLHDDNLHTRYIYSALALHTYPGGLLSDAHINLELNLEHLADLARDRASWNEYVENL